MTRIALAPGEQIGLPPESQQHAPGVISSIAETVRGTRLGQIVAIGLTAGTALAYAGEAIFPANSVSAQSSRQHPKKLAVIGDSVAGGQGLPQSPNASSEDKACARSPLSYPVRVGTTLGMKLVKDAACRGAVVNNLTHTQTLDGTTVRPQLKTAYASGRPDVLIGTFGANDVHFADVVKDCLTGPHPCNSRANTRKDTVSLVALRKNLTKSFAAIKLLPGPAPETVLTGYYDLVSPACALLPGVTLSEVAWLNNETHRLNKTLENTTAKFSFAKFASVEAKFKRHDACSRQPWVQRLGEAAAHPTAEGQGAIADAVIETLRR